MVEIQEITLPCDENIVKILGPGNINLKLIEEHIDIVAGLRGNKVQLKGETEDIKMAIKVLEEITDWALKGRTIKKEDVLNILNLIKKNPETEPQKIFDDVILVTSRKKLITPKSVAQKEYVEAIKTHDLVISIGPAGTGKTYLAMAMAVSELLSQRVRRIILTRPAVEAGEKLGFLPGDIIEKVNPYLRPLYDALHDMMEIDKIDEFISRGKIEVAPLAFMRGRTLNDSFVILDEAQNTTHDQMKMFLTRLGLDSKAVVTGDITQIDLPDGMTSGLIETEKILKGIKEVGFCYFTDTDVVRHTLVKKIIKAYEIYEKKNYEKGQNNDNLCKSS